jgi:hypothetical protein
MMKNDCDFNYRLDISAIHDSHYYSSTFLVPRLCGVLISGTLYCTLNSSEVDKWSYTPFSFADLIGEAVYW